MKVEIDITSSDLAWSMKDEDPEIIVEFIRDFFDHSFTKATTEDLVLWTVNFLCSDHNVKPDLD